MSTPFSENRIAVLYHIFYEDGIGEISRELSGIAAYNPLLLFNICDVTPGKSAMAESLKQAFPNSIIVFSSNRGKDIGGKLTLLSLYQQLGVQTDYMIFLHDKKSLQALKSSRWKKDLVKIIEPEHIPSILGKFASDRNCGMVATREYIVQENMTGTGQQSTNTEKIKELTARYGLLPQGYQYVAGTMFWVRTAQLETFFRQHDPLEIRKTLEDGNVLDNFSGTVTHSWERLFSWIVTAQGYKIQGI